MIFRTLWLICAMAWVLGGTSALAQQAAPKPEGYFGNVLFEDITKEEAEKLGWKTPRGIRVLDLEKGGPVANAGIQPGDIIVSLDGKEVENGEALARSITAIGDKSIGAQVRFGYLRSGKEHTATVTLGPPPVIPPPQEPILRIEPGMPMGSVLHVGADAACTLLATASDDATVRLWRVRDGKLLRTLRAPLPAGIHLVQAVVVAPDGSWTAAGGWAASTWSSRGSLFVYVFENATGTIAARLGPLNGAISRLAVLPLSNRRTGGIWRRQRLQVMTACGCGRGSGQAPRTGEASCRTPIMAASSSLTQPSTARARSTRSRSTASCGATPFPEGAVAMEINRSRPGLPPEGGSTRGPSPCIPQVTASP